MNKNSKQLVDLPTEKGLVTLNTWFKDRDISNYTCVSGKGKRACLVCLMVK